MREETGGSLTAEVSEQRDHIAGPVTAAVTLVEYGDFECPYCGQAYPIVKKVQQHFGDKLRLVFRNFPLAQMHPHAQHAAEAAESASAQGKFWEMHDLLYERQNALQDVNLVAYAGEIGLDVERFGRDLASNAYADRIREDFRSGVRSGVNGTPTFFINGKRHDGPFDLRTLTDAIEGAMGRETHEKHRGHGG